MAAPPGEDCLWRLLDLLSPGLHLGMHVCGCGGDGGKPLTRFAWLEQPEVCERHSVQWAVQFFFVEAFSFRLVLSPCPCPSSTEGALAFLAPLLSSLATLLRSLASPPGFGGSSAQSSLLGLFSSSASDMPIGIRRSHSGQCSSPPSLWVGTVLQLPTLKPPPFPVTPYVGLFTNTLHFHVSSHECSTISRQCNCAYLGIRSGSKGFVGRVRDRSVALGCPPIIPCEPLGSPTQTRRALSFKSSAIVITLTGSTQGFAFYRTPFCLGSLFRGPLVGRARGRSVALGCPPTSLPRTSCVPWESGTRPTWGAFVWLFSCADQVVAFFITLQALFLLAMWRLLVRALPGRSSPLSRFLLFPSASATDGLVLPLGGFRVVQGDLSHRGKGDRVMRPPGPSLPDFSRRTFGPSWLLLALGFASLPAQVWAAPKGLHEALSHADLVIAARDASLDASNPEHLNHDSGESANPWRQVVAQVQAESLCDAYGPEVFGDFPGLAADLQPSSSVVSAVLGEAAPAAREGTPIREPMPPTLGLPSETGLDASEVDVTEPGVALDVPAFVAAAGYRIASCTVGVSFPSHVEALENQVRTHAADLLEECGDQLAPVYPHVVPGVAAFVAFPPWFSEARLITAFLDARAIRGHAFAIVLSFPTTVEEIQRAAGFSSVMAHEVFVSGHPSPLGPGSIVELQAGALIRLLPVGSKPLWAAPLAFALWHPHYWPSGVLVPRTREAGCALALHSSGKYLYDRFCSDDWANLNGIAALVGVPLAEVRMQAANPQEMMPYVPRLPCARSPCGR